MRRWRLDADDAAPLQLRVQPAASVGLMLRIDHPTRCNVLAVAGHDPVAGCFVDVVCDERAIASYDCFHALFHRARPVMGCLDFL